MSYLSSFFEAVNGVDLLSVFVKLLLASVLGGVIGAERGQKRRAAGLRTHLLVCIGATLAMMTNQYISIVFGGDPSRLGAQVISGIGFLGAGTILVTRTRHVKGLTTAAGLWASACMGLAIGIGFYEAAILACFFIWFSMVTLHSFDAFLLKRSRVFELYIEFADAPDLSNFIASMAGLGIKVTAIEHIGGKENKPGAGCVLVTLRFERKGKHGSVLDEVSKMPGILFVEYI